jgi:DNA-binding response OmpR family regulator
MRPDKVMIVDDDQALLLALTEALLFRLPHVSVEPLASPEEALRRLSHRRYAAVVTDLKMPHIDGLTLLRTVKAQQRGVPVVIMSAEIDRSIVEQLLAEDADDVIPKPFDRVEFARIVTSILQRRRLARRVKAISLSLNHDGERVACLERRLKSEFNNLTPPLNPPGERQASLPRVPQSLAMKREQLKEDEADLMAAKEWAKSQMRRRLKML